MKIGHWETGKARGNAGEIHKHKSEELQTYIYETSADEGYWGKFALDKWLWQSFLVVMAFFMELYRELRVEIVGANLCVRPIAMEIMR